MNYQNELAFAKDLALEAGKIMRRYFKAEDIGTEWKGDSTPVTLADTKVNSLVIDRVKKQFPSHGVFGEEESYEKQRDLIWVVDPIDGTMPFSLGIPVSTFSIALVDRKDGQPILAVVFDPFLNHLYSAVQGKGAFLNGKSLKASGSKQLSRNYFYVAGGFKKGPKIYNTGALVDTLRAEDSKVLVVASFIYFGMKVATGELAGAVVGLTTNWDLVTTALMVEEAGGVVTDLDGKKQRYDGEVNGIIVAGTKEIHEQLMKAVKASKT